MQVFVTESFRALLKSRLYDSSDDEWTDAVSLVRSVSSMHTHTRPFVRDHPGELVPER